MNTATFSIERKVRLVYKVLPPIILGAAAYLFIKSNEPEPLEGPPDPESIILN